MMLEIAPPEKSGKMGSAATFCQISLEGQFPTILAKWGQQQHLMALLQ
jgi:hypothetical protein